MTIIGIDMAKDSFVGMRIDRSSSVKEQYIIPNTKEAIGIFLQNLQLRWKKLLLGSESTAEYHRMLAELCIEANIPFKLLNPITTKQFTKATVRTKKTDLTDAHVVAKLLLQGEGQMLGKESFSLTKPLLRTATKLSQMKQRLTVMKGRLERLEVDERLVEKIEECIEQLQETENEYERYGARGQDQELSKLLQTIPGIGVKTAGILIAEIGDITHFKTGKSLIAFCGLDPKVKQSGISLHHNTHLTKRGSPYLRKAIFFAANIAEFHDEALKEYYDKKRREGKEYKEATVAVARKLLYRVYAVWRRKTPYTA